MTTSVLRCLLFSNWKINRSLKAQSQK